MDERAGCFAHDMVLEHWSTRGCQHLGHERVQEYRTREVARTQAVIFEHFYPLEPMKRLKHVIVVGVVVEYFSSQS